MLCSRDIAVNKKTGVRRRVVSAMKITELLFDASSVVYLRSSFCFTPDAFYDNFTLLPSRVEQIADGILERGYDLKWWNFSRVDTIISE